MPDTRYFNAIAQNLAEEMGAPHASIDPIVEQFRRIAHDVALALGPWTHHHVTCALTDTGACDCGLNAELDKWER